MTDDQFDQMMEVLGEIAENTKSMSANCFTIKETLTKVNTIDSIYDKLVEIESVLRNR